MYSVSVRDHVMIAHSFRGEIFGPAQRLHGATYVVDVEITAAKLDVHGLVVDIARAQKIVRSVLAELDYRNLDDLPAFTGENTTTEFLAKAIFDRILLRIQTGELTSDARRLSALKVTLAESHVARASYVSGLSLGQ